MKDRLSRVATVSLLVFGILVIFTGILARGIEMESSDNSYERPAIEVFGAKSGEPIERGFVFKDGAYIDAPYVVSRHGMDVYVNGVKIDTLGGWPPLDYEDKKPEMPVGLTKNSTFDDLKIAALPGESLDRKMVRWLRRHYNGERSKELIIEYYRSLPFVKDVTTDTDMDATGHILAISTWNSDRITLVDIGGPVYIPATAEEIEKELERVHRRFETRLTNGECIFLFSSGGELAFGSRKAAMDLPAIVHTLRSDKPKDQKVKELQNLGLLPPRYPRKWEVLVTRFLASPQLDTRVKQLGLPPGNKREHEPTVEEENSRIEQMNEKAAKK